jgi:arginase family enzyme
MLKLIAIIEAPSILGLRPTGVEDLPDALVSAGLLARLQARHAGRVNAPMYGDVRDRETGFLNTHGIADYSRRLAERVDEVFGQGEFALVLGGDCSILLGPMLALNLRGRHGLLFLDGHMDFYAYASGQGTREFWIRFDADVLDDSIIPAVDYRLPGGLIWVEHVLSAALAHPGAVGMEITIFNPRLDTDGKVLSAFLNLLSSAFPNTQDNCSR